MNTKHTAGIWTVVPMIVDQVHTLRIAADEPGESYATVVDHVYKRADATLISAAPELLEALRLCASFIENVSEDTPDRTDRFFACREAWRNALGKAEQS